MSHNVMLHWLCSYHHDTVMRTILCKETEAISHVHRGLLLLLLLQTDLFLMEKITEEQV